MVLIRENIGHACIFIVHDGKAGGFALKESVEKKTKINSVQTRCIVKGEAQKSPLFWRFSGGF